MKETDDTLMCLRRGSHLKESALCYPQARRLHKHSTKQVWVFECSHECCHTTEGATTKQDTGWILQREHKAKGMFGEDFRVPSEWVKAGPEPRVGLRKRRY